MKTRCMLVALGLLFGLVAAETGLRCFAVPFHPHMRSRIYFTQYDATLGWTNRPGVKGPYAGNEFSAYVTINAAGQRGRLYDESRSSGRQRLLLLGDSQAWGDGVNDNETFADLLASSGPEVINAACLGYGTAQELLLLQRIGARYSPDIVLTAVFVGNDFGDNMSPGTSQYPRPYFTLADNHVHNVPVPYHAVTQAAVRAYRKVAMHSVVFSLIAEAYGHSLRQSATPHDLRSPQSFYLPQLEERDAEAFTLTGRLLRQVGSEASAIGARAMVLLIPEDWQVQIATHPELQRAARRQGSFEAPAGNAYPGPPRRPRARCTARPRGGAQAGGRLLPAVAPSHPCRPPGNRHAPYASPCKPEPGIPVRVFVAWGLPGTGKENAVHLRQQPSGCRWRISSGNHIICGVLPKR